MVVTTSYKNNLTLSWVTMTSPPSMTNTLPLTSVWQKDSLAVRLDIRLTRVRGWQCYSILTGMELAVDLGTGPGQSLTVEKGNERMRC